MNGRLHVLAVVTCLALWGVGLSGVRSHAQEAPRPPAEIPVLSEPADFSLEETSGQTRTLAAVRGRIAIVFYEDREHTPDNQELKLQA